MEHSNTNIIEAFLAAWNARDLDGIMAHIAPDCVYHNMPMEPVTGRDAIREALAPFVAGATAIDWQTLHIAETGKGHVLTERVDSFTFPDHAITVRVMGIFELKDRLINHWRDYFDMEEFTRQMPAR